MHFVPSCGRPPSVSVPRRGASGFIDRGHATASHQLFPRLCDHLHWLLGDVKMCFSSTPARLIVSAVTVAATATSCRFPTDDTSMAYPGICLGGNSEALCFSPFPSSLSFFFYPSFSFPFLFLRLSFPIPEKNSARPGSNALYTF